MGNDFHIKFDITFLAGYSNASGYIEVYSSDSWKVELSTEGEFLVTLIKRGKFLSSPIFAMVT